jgi:hypothetical protein
MSAIPITPEIARRRGNCPDRGMVGMACLILAESAIFIIFVVAYIYYIGKSLSGPTPKQVLEYPIIATICLLSSSFTAHAAVSALRKSKVGTCAAWLAATILLALVFLGYTAEGVVRTDLPLRPDDQDQPLRHDFLLAGRPACDPRCRRPDHADDCADRCAAQRR